MEDTAYFMGAGMPIQLSEKISLKLRWENSQKFVMYAAATRLERNCSLQYTFSRFYHGMT